MFLKKNLHNHREWRVNICRFHVELFHFSLRVLCETVKDFVSKVGSTSATSDPSEADDPDSLAQKVSIVCSSCLTLFITQQLSVSIGAILDEICLNL